VSPVFRNERMMAAMTIRPAHVGHVLLFPKAHAEDFALLDPAELADLFHAAARLKLAICEAIACDGFQLVVNQGEATGQKRNCRHLHVHLIPCSLNAPAHTAGRPPDAARSELDLVASKIAARLSLDAA
jgi:histidine triad (HIT) family protein